MPTQLISPLAASAATESMAAPTDAWGIAAVGADRDTLTGAGVRIAVLDTGIDASHPAFAGITLHQKDFSRDGDGDVNGHGTHCAGTIFGQDIHGRIGIARGIREAWIGKVLGNDGNGDTVMLTEGLNWALSMRAHIISMSVGINFAASVGEHTAKGMPLPLATSKALVAYGANLRLFDALFAFFEANALMRSSPLTVAAVGNDSFRASVPAYAIGPSLPAAAKHVLAVGALGRANGQLSLASFSNEGVQVCAPGVDIRSAWPGGERKCSAALAWLARTWLASRRCGAKTRSVSVGRYQLNACARKCSPRVPAHSSSVPARISMSARVWLRRRMGASERKRVQGN